MSSPSERTSHSFSGLLAPPGKRHPIPITAIGTRLPAILDSKLEIIDRAIQLMIARLLKTNTVLCRHVPNQSDFHVHELLNEIYNISGEMNVSGSKQTRVVSAQYLPPS